MNDPHTSMTPTAICFGANAAADPLYPSYHDTEWGRPSSEIVLFEHLCLEAFQVGLSWRTILHKRDAFREAFASFDPDAIAKFTDEDVERLATNAAIVRNRAKIKACVNAARIVSQMHEDGETLSALVNSFAPPSHDRPEVGAVPVATPESTSLAKELHKRGFRFVGPVNVYALMQACGVVNDHVVGCPIGDEIAADASGVSSGR
ncbi:MAG: DNA-3-methyladenine glycosylase I [Propionibacteriaceae bacterium]|nr:DNA-3-methyladenine glycosylase I [Propionibacteriaceae bacterium]